MRTVRLTTLLEFAVYAAMIITGLAIAFAVGALLVPDDNDNDEAPVVTSECVWDGYRGFISRVGDEASSLQVVADPACAGAQPG